jgi:hypothetical protein
LEDAIRARRTLEARPCRSYASDENLTTASFSIGGLQKSRGSETTLGTDGPIDLGSGGPRSRHRSRDLTIHCAHLWVWARARSTRRLPSPARGPRRSRPYGRRSDSTQFGNDPNSTKEIT